MSSDRTPFPWPAQSATGIGSMPGTDMAEATAKTVAYSNRALSIMPAGSLPPYVVRLDAGSLPVGYLVFESQGRSVGELEDMALFRVRTMFSGLAGGGSTAHTTPVQAPSERIATSIQRHAQSWRASSLNCRQAAPLCICVVAPVPISAAKNRRCWKASRVNAAYRATSRRIRFKLACSAGRR